MASIKKFFEKKRQDAKFKKLGQGHKLTEESSPQSPSAGGPRATAGAPPPRDLNQTETQRAAALAAVARLDRQSQKQNPQWSKTFIRAEAKKQAAAQEGASQSASRTGPVELEGPGALATSGVYFKCPIIGPEVFPKDDMIAKIRAFLYEQYEEEPALTSVLIIFSLNNPSKVEVCVATLRKYLENITQNPTEPKYRKIRKSNRVFQERVLPVEGAEKFLEAAGFKRTTEEDNEEYLVYPDDGDVTELETLVDALSNAEAVKPELDRGLRVLQPSRATENINLPPEFFVLTAEELRMEQKQREELAAKLTQLRTKAMRERDEILEHRQYKYALIRVRFPDGVLLQGTFGVYEKVSAVLDFVRENLSDPDSGFKLSTSGTGVSFEYPSTSPLVEKTLVEAKLVPATVLNFSWTNVGSETAAACALHRDVLALLEEN